MAKLVLVQGPGAGRQIPLENRPIIMGRQPGVEVVLDAPEVSRQHVKIELQDEQYFIEDLGSSNGTFVNSARLEGKSRLHARDQIKVGPYLFMFEATAVTEPEVLIQAEVSAHTSNLKLFKQDPARKLQTVLEIAQHLANSLELDELLPKLLDHLLGLFLQADRALILMREGEQLVLRAMRSRAASASGPAYSRTVVLRVLDEGIGIVAADARADLRFATETLRATGIRSFLCVPFKTHDGRPLGVLQLDRFGFGAPFAAEDLHLLTAIALQVSVVLENAALHADLLRQERVKRDLALAREIQEGFLPQDFLAVAGTGAELFARVYPARDVSGDFYDFFVLDGKRLGFLVADVSGKGIPAALFMIAVRTLGRHLAWAGTSPAAALQTLNDTLAADNPAGMFVTMALGTLDATTGEVVLCCGGHPPPLIRRQNGNIEEVPTSPGRVLGFSRGPLPLTDTRLSLAAGESLILYTDGVTDAQAPDSHAMFGMEQFMAALRELPPHQSPEEWTSAIKTAVDRFTGASDLYDDITLMLLRRPASGAGL